MRLFRRGPGSERAWKVVLLGGFGEEGGDVHEDLGLLYKEV